MASQTFIAASIWVFCSIGMMVFNKLAVGMFPLECTLVCLQMTFTVLIVTVCGWNSLRIGSFKDLLLWMRVAPFFAGVLLTSMLALKNAPMSLVIVFRGIAPFFGLAVERLYPQPLQVSRLTVASLIGMVAGVVIYAEHMPQGIVGSLSGVCWVLLNNVFVIGDRLLQRLMLDRHQAPVDVSKASCTIINNLLGAVIVGGLAVGKGEISKLPDVLAGLDLSSAFIVGLTCVVGTGIAYAGIWLQSLITVTSFLVLATANKFALLLIEVVMLNSHLTLLQAVGATIVISCGVAYGKSREETVERAEEKRLMVPESTAPEKKV